MANNNNQLSFILAHCNFSEQSFLPFSDPSFASFHESLHGMLVICT